MFFIKIIALALEFAHRYSKKRVSNNLLLLVTTKLSEDLKAALNQIFMRKNLRGIKFVKNCMISILEKYHN